MRLTDPDFNQYDTQHCVGTHPHLRASDVVREYRDAYRAFYTWRRLAWSVTTLHRVGSLAPAARLGMLSQQIYYTYATRRGRHPMLGGIWRQRDGTVRRAVIDDHAAAQWYLDGGAPALTPGALPDPEREPARAPRRSSLHHWAAGS